MIDRFFKDIYLYFYIGVRKNRPKNAYIQNKVAAAVMTGFIGASIGYNIVYAGLHVGYISHTWKGSLILKILLINLPFVLFFYNRGEKYIKSVPDLASYPLKLKLVVYYYIFCILTAGIATFFI